MKSNINIVGPFFNILSSAGSTIEVTQLFLKEECALLGLGLGIGGSWGMCKKGSQDRTIARRAEDAELSASKKVCEFSR